MQDVGRTTIAAEPTGNEPVRHAETGIGHPPDRLLNGDFNNLGGDRRIVRNVVLVGQNKLQRVAPRRQVECHFRLPTTKMHVIFVGWNIVNKLIGSIFTLAERRPIDEKVMMTGHFLVRAGRCHPHPGKAEDDGERRINGRTILEIDKIDLGSKW